MVGILLQAYRYPGIGLIRLIFSPVKPRKFSEGSVLPGRTVKPRDGERNLLSQGLLEIINKIRYPYLWSENGGRQRVT